MVNKDAQRQVPRRSVGKRGKLGVNRRLLKSRKTKEHLTSQKRSGESREARLSYERYEAHFADVVFTQTSYVFCFMNLHL